MKDGQKVFLIGIIVLVIIAFIAFGIGMAFQRVRLSRFYSVRSGVGMYAGPMRGWTMGPQMMRGYRTGALSGTITNISGNTVIVKLSNGSTKTINLSSSTQYSQVSTASQSNLQQGQNVTITGQLQQGGSLNANSLRINLTQ